MLSPVLAWLVLVGAPVDQALEERREPVRPQGQAAPTGGPWHPKVSQWR